ncbi:MAG TPA: SGNH/GDSL hydrolase family protein [Thermoanaerobaculia bacterium]|nr:SGNH/GDSL hydrolase family protein [Thermoanaerobaculia bacterium]
MKKNLLHAATLIIANLLAATPSFAARGTADFTRLYALGTSLSAGVESASLNERHQRFSPPAIVATQVGRKLCEPNASATDDCFAQPLVTYPGIGPEMVLVNFAPTFSTETSTGVPAMLSFGRPYNNLAIPGAIAADAITLTGKEAPTRTAQVFAQFILRGLGTAADQALSQRPTFLVVEFGANELLGALQLGTPKALVPLDVFRTSFTALIDKLTAGAPTAGMVVTNVPTNPDTLPLVNTVPPFLVDPTTRQPVLGPDGKPVYYIAELGDGTVGQLPPGSKILLTATTEIATGYGLPAALKPLFPTLPNVGRPLPDRFVLTPAEIAQIVARANEMNGVISQVATSKDIPVADFKGLFDRIASGRLFVGPFNITGAFLTGGFFSFDGAHFTDIGYTLFANEIIKAINAGYKTEIPVASIAPLLQNNGAFFPETAQVDPRFTLLTKEASAAIMSLAPPPPSTKRLRASNH